MGKGKKILIYVVISLLAASIFLPLLTAGLLCLPAFQTFAVKQAARVVSSKLETTVSVGSLYLKPFSSIEINDLYIEDYNKDTLLSVATLSADIRSLGLLSGRVALGVVKLRDGVFYLAQNSDGVLNLKQILDRLKSKNPTKSNTSFRLEAFGLDISGLHFKYRKNVVTPRDGVNFDDIEVDDFKLHAHSIYLVDDSVSLTINRLSLKEKSGFVLDRLSSGRMSVSGTGLRFRSIGLYTPHSSANFHHLNMTYDSWSAYSTFISSVHFDAAMTNSRVSFATIAYFAPQLRSWTTVLEQADITVQGTIDNFAGELHHVRSRSTTLSADYAIKGIPDIENTDFKVKVKRLKTIPADIDFFAKDIAHSSLAGAMTSINRLDHISLTGNFFGLLRRFSADASVLTPRGGLDTRMTIVTPSDGNTSMDGVVMANRVDAGAIVGSDYLGKTSFTAKVNGRFTRKGFTIDTDAMISELFLNGHSYSGLEMNGVVQNKTFKGDIISRDENLAFDFKGFLNFTDSIPFYDFDLDLRRADLARLGINKRDSISVLSCKVLAHTSGRTFDEMNGNITIDDVLYVSPMDSVRTGQIIIRGENSAHSKMLGVYSSFVDLEFRSRMSYKRLVDYVTYTVQEYFPTLLKKPHVDLTSDSDNATSVANYSVVKMQVKEANKVAGIFVPGLELAKGTNMQLLFNPDAKQLSFSIKSDYIESPSFFLSNLDLNSRNQSDSLVVYMRATEFLYGNLRFPALSILGGAKSNVFNLSARFHDEQDGSGGLVGFTSSLGTNAQGAPQIRIRLQPSTLSSAEKTWRLSVREILIDSSRVEVNNFRLTSSGQEFAVSGIASKSMSDTLRVRLSNFDMNALSRFTIDTGYDITGISNGYANIASAMKRPLISSQLLFDSVKVNGITVPALAFDSRWDFNNERAKFAIANRESRDTVVLGYFRPTDSRVRVDANLKGLDLSLLNPPLASVIEGTKGLADATLTVTGTPKQLYLNGKVSVRDLTTRVDFTGVNYSVPVAEMSIVDNLFTLKPTPIFDSEKNRGDMEMRLNLNSFKNIIYDLRVRPNKMLVLNTSQLNNDFFYGKVYGTGAATIRGDKMGVNMNIVAATEDNSSFFMPLSGKSDIATADFVVFEQPIAAQNTKSQLDEYKERQKKRDVRKSATGQKSDMNINLSLTVKPNTDFQLVIDPTVGDIIRGRGNGAINMQINPNNGIFTMYGDYTITEGSYLFTLQKIINKKFVIEPGSSIVWTGDPLNANLNITAIYKLKASLAPLLAGDETNLQRTVPVDCEIKLTEGLRQPAIAFDVQLPNVDPDIRNLVANTINTPDAAATQFFWLIAANTFYSDTGAGTQGQNIGAASTSAIGFEFLSNQLNNWLASDKFDFGMRYRPKSDMTSDEFDFYFTQDIISNRLQLEVESNFDFGNNVSIKNENANNISGDVSLTGTLDKSGRLKAKVFTRTIDRFDENRGLQESGAGIYYKEDFNKFKDVINGIKDWFLGKRKLAKRAEREQKTKQNK